MRNTFFIFWGGCDKDAIQDKGTQGCQVWQTHFFLIRIFLLRIYLKSVR